MSHSGRANPRIGVVLTILNEFDSIYETLESICLQTSTPDEVWIVDAGSTDGTLERIDTFIKKNPSLRLSLLLKPGANRSEGRNIGAASCGYVDYVLFTDAGCGMKHDWVANLVDTVVENAYPPAIGGAFETRATSIKGEVIGSYISPDLNILLRSEYLPTARNLMVRKDVFDQTGFDESLTTCEDLEFSRRLHISYGILIVPEIDVWWYAPETFTEMFVRMAGYTAGDVEAGYRPHLKKIVSMYLRYLLFVMLPPLWLVYLGYFGLTKRASQLSKVPYAVVGRFVVDVAVIWGSLVGISRRIRY